MKQVEYLLEKIQQCKLCSTIDGYQKFPSNSHGNLDADYMLISEAPSKESLNKSKYWTGCGGKLIRAACNEWGVNLEDLFYLTDVVKCWPTDNRKPNKHEIRNCFPYLKEEIKVIDPKLILAFGSTVSNTLLCCNEKMKSKHLRISTYNDHLMLTLYHPSNINLHMNVNNYKEQIKGIMKNIISGDIYAIFKDFPK